MLNRRNFIKFGSLLGLSALPFARTTFANVETDARYVLVILRGGMDGLAAVPAYGDRYYRDLRGTLALPSPKQENGILDLDGFFGLHPAMQNLHSMYKNKEAKIFHAVASPYRERSHFDAQRLLENGTNQALGADDGWLNRALANTSTGKNSAIALAQKVPLILYGSQAVNSWTPNGLNIETDDVLDRLARLYADEPFFIEQLNSGLETQAMVGEMLMQEGGGNRVRANQLVPSLNATAQFLSDPNGPRIAVVESSGWDTHANQGSTRGRLANQLSDLDAGLGSLKQGLGSAWNNTIVTVVTEFGRTAAVNGSNGTDHGTGGVAFMVGGAVNGGSLQTDWPGLAKNDLYEGRDLAASIDTRSLFKSTLHDHLKISRSALENTIFPDSTTAPLLSDIVKS